MKLQHRFFPVNVAKFLRTPISKNICERLLLIIVIYCIKNWLKLLRNQISLLFHFTSDQSFVSNHSILLTLIRFHSFFLLLIVICCHSLSLIVTRFNSLSFVVTRFTTRLSLYKRSLLMDVLNRLSLIQSKK